jgi:hypothetical protein
VDPYFLLNRQVAVRYQGRSAQQHSSSSQMTSYLLTHTLSLLLISPRQNGRRRFRPQYSRNLHHHSNGLSETALRLLDRGSIQHGLWLAVGSSFMLVFWVVFRPDRSPPILWVTSSIFLPVPTSRNKIPFLRIDSSNVDHPHGTRDYPCLV